MCAKHSQADGDDTVNDGQSSDGTYERRSLLKSALGFGAASALAGCGSDSGGGSTDATTDPQSVSSATESPTAASDPTSTQTDVQGHQEPSDGVTIVPPDGDIQAALEDAADGATYARSPWGTVRLQSGETYEVAETIEMPLYSVLDFNGARMVPTENVDVIDASAGSRLVRPYIDAKNNSSWDSNLIRVSTRIKKIESIDPVIIEGMWIRAPIKQGTGVKIIDSNGEGLWSVHMSGMIQLGETGIHLRAEGENSWVNSCYFDGIIRGNATAVLMDADPTDRPVNAHKFDVTFQPSGSAGPTDWVWDMQQGDRNKIRATIWDKQHIKNQTVWRIGENAEMDNVLIDDMSGYNWRDHVVENKFGGAPNGASGNTLFNWSVAQNHMDLRNTVDDLRDEVADLREQVNGN